MGEDFGRNLVFLFVSNLVLTHSVTMEDDGGRGYALEEAVHDHGFTHTPKPFKIRAEKRR